MSQVVVPYSETRKRAAPYLGKRSAFAGMRPEYYSGIDSNYQIDTRKSMHTDRLILERNRKLR